MSRPTKVTPAMVHAIYKLTMAGQIKREICKEVGISPGVLKKVRAGTYPALDIAGKAAWRKSFGLSSALSKSLSPKSPAHSVFLSRPEPTLPTKPAKPATAPISRPVKKLASEGLRTAEAVPVVQVSSINSTQEDPMLLPKQTLSQAACQQFRLFSNPFDGDVTRDEEMFLNGEIRFVREMARLAALNGRFMAIVGESGAGKTTMLNDLKEQILRERKPVVFIQPSVLGMEDSDLKGKSIKSAGIQTAIVMTLGPSEGVAQSDEKRARQVKRMLEESTTAGRTHLLVIEEAHSLPIPTLKHLKRLWESMTLGRRPMLGVLLLGHPELQDKLSRFDVREVAQRCQVAQLGHLGDDLTQYLEFRANNLGRKLDEFISVDGVAELTARLTVSAGVGKAPVSLLYPLNVNNWMAAALNMAADLGVPIVDRDVVRAV